MNGRILIASALLLIGSTSCVSKKKLAAEQAKYAELNTFYTQVQTDLKTCRDAQDEAARRRAQLETDLESARTQLAAAKESNTLMVNQLQSLSVISASQAESIRKSLENINGKDALITDLNRAIQRKDSLNMALVMNLKSALKDVNDQDIEVKVEKSAIFISISDKLLFKSGSYDVTPAAMTVLGKVAQVLNSKPEIEFLVEGHTDNVPVSLPGIQDNWDLSTKRATSIVRILQKQYSIDPKRMTAGGRGEYLPVQPNDSPSGKAANRRTRIVILPQLDQFFKLLETPQASK
ncbi:OmpA/MotB family protein [Flaviaesturariibacter aridisoli]|uniref:OmpA-like domain-containing protein n=1 Tax=Flaviaesturariibacter aridisoli TaxID=2545761 RepID=A0A4R4DZW8_9BACT|nr:OmpA family protein [Flaviaesturariibacter aridisoli]TCZ70509.1 hypothetical protein E0486_11170 [Flaviaesturariibacter aridisoli]